MQHGLRRRRPWVVVMSSCSIDGRTSPMPHTSSRVFVPLTPKLLTKRFMDLRREVDAIMVGSETVLIDNPRLIRENQNPDALRVIVDSRGRVNGGRNILSDRYRSLMLVAKNTPKSYKRMVSSIKNKDYLECGRDRVDLRLALERLYGLGVRRMLVEGGGSLVYRLLSRGLVDEMRLVYIPMFIGDVRSSSVVAGDASLFGRAGLKIRRLELHGGFVYLEGKVDYKLVAFEKEPVAGKGP